MINDATIVESEIFVYNLGTMFYTDKVLFATLDSLPTATKTTTVSTSTDHTYISTMETELTESVPDELTEENGHLPDVLFADSEPPTTVTHSINSHPVSILNNNTSTTIKK